jgi:hypothetical protein
MSVKKPAFSLNQLNTRKPSETPYTFPFIFDGKDIGVSLSVIGQQSETFTRKAAEISKNYALSEGLESPDKFLLSEKNKEMMDKLVAARLVGWTGIKDEFNEEAAYQFVRDTAGAFDQIITASNKIGNFIKL